MDQNEMYETQAGMEDSSERLEKKEQLRAKVQALVSYYEDEKRRNEELTMELERLKAEQQQMQGMSGPISMGGPAAGMNGPMAGPSGNGMSPPPAGGMAPGGFPPAGGVPFAQRPQQANAFAPAPEFSPAPPQPSQGMPPQGPAGYTLQSFGAPQPPQGMSPQGFGMPPQGMPPQRPPMPPQQNPYGAPQPPFGQPGGFPPQPQPPAPQPFGQPGFPPAPQPFGPGVPGIPGSPGFGAGPQGMYPPQPPAYPGQGMGLTENIGTVLQTITQVRAKLHQFESIRGYGYPQQPAYVDYDTVALLDKLYDQLGDLSRELMQRR